MAATFLDDRQLGSAIAEVLGGMNVRCAVAFWGKDAVAHLFPAGLPESARILCDLTIGSTNPDELRAMHAPGNPFLKHIERLHAKVYISNRGAIVCSANASNNGIGFVDIAGLTEAGVLLDANSTAYRQAAAWFKRVWRRAEPVDQPALDRATEAWNRHPRNSGGRRGLPIPTGAPSLLATVTADPLRYRGIGFVFTNGRADKEERSAACVAIELRDDARPEKLLSLEERRKLRRWAIGDLFTGWSEQELDAWPRRFICIHRPRQRTTYWFYQRVEEVLLGPDRGVIFAERPRNLRTDLGFDHGREAMLATDTPILDRLFAHCEQRGHWLCENGEKLLELMDEALGT